MLEDLFVNVVNQEAPEQADCIGIVEVECEKILNKLTEDCDSIQHKIYQLLITSKFIKEISSHPRVQCRLQMSKFVEVDGLLNTSEFKLKYGDYSVISSLKITSEYCQKSQDRLEDDIKSIKNHKEKTLKQQMLACTVTSRKMKEVHLFDNSTLTVYENGLVDIVEKSSEPITRVERKARFKTNQERNKYVMQKVKDPPVGE